MPRTKLPKVQILAHVIVSQETLAKNLQEALVKRAELQEELKRQNKFIERCTWDLVRLGQSLRKEK